MSIYLSLPSLPRASLFWDSCANKGRSHFLHVSYVQCKEKDLISFLFGYVNSWYFSRKLELRGPRSGMAINHMYISIDLHSFYSRVGWQFLSLFQHSYDTAVASRQSPRVPRHFLSGRSKLVHIVQYIHTYIHIVESGWGVNIPFWEDRGDDIIPKKKGHEVVNNCPALCWTTYHIRDEWNGRIQGNSSFKRINAQSPRMTTKLRLLVSALTLRILPLHAQEEEDHSNDDIQDRKTPISLVRPFSRIFFSLVFLGRCRFKSLLRSFKKTISLSFSQTHCLVYLPSPWSSPSSIHSSQLTPSPTKYRQQTSTA